MRYCYNSRVTTDRNILRKYRPNVHKNLISWPAPRVIYLAKDYSLRGYEARLRVGKNLGFYVFFLNFFFFAKEATGIYS